MKAKVIEHTFFNNGALLFIIRHEMVFLYPSELDDQFCVWYTCRDYVKENLKHFLNECAEGKHSDEGSSTIGPFKEMIAEINFAAQ